MTRDMRLGRNEYLGKEETGARRGRGAPRSSSVTRSSGSCTVDRGGFSFGGHRLSSLYRKTDPGAPGLILGYPAASSLEKYSPGVRGWKTPALAVAAGTEMA